MKKFSLILIICLGFYSASFSQTSKKQELIKELFALQKNDSATGNLMNTIMPLIMNQNKSQQKDSASIAKANQVMNVVVESVNGLMERLQTDKIALYDKYFTEKEIKKMTAFYKSSAGRKMVETQPEITKELVQKVISDYLPEFKKSIEEKMKQAVK